MNQIHHVTVPLVSILYRRDDYIWIVSGCEDHRVKVFAQPASRESDFKFVSELKGHDNAILAVDVNDRRTIMATSDVSAKVNLWRRITYKHLRT